MMEVSGLTRAGLKFKVKVLQRLVVCLQERKGPSRLGRVGPSSCFLWFVVGSQTVSLPPSP